MEVTEVDGERPAEQFPTVIVMTTNPGLRLRLTETLEAAGAEVVVIEDVDRCLATALPTGATLLLLDPGSCNGALQHTLDRLNGHCAAATTALLLGWWDEREETLAGIGVRTMHVPPRIAEVREHLARAERQAVVQAAAPPPAPLATGATEHDAAVHSRRRHHAATAS